MALLTVLADSVYDTSFAVTVPESGPERSSATQPIAAVSNAPVCFLYYKDVVQIGNRVQVYRSGDEAYYGRVLSYFEQSGKALENEDEDSEGVDLKKRQIAECL